MSQEMDKIDKVSYHLISYSLILLGWINIVLYLAPFIVFKEYRSIIDNGFQVLSWYSLSFTGSPFIATSMWIILILSSIILVYGVYIFVDKVYINYFKHLVLVKRLINIHFFVTIALLITVFLFVDSLNFEMSGTNQVGPVGGWGLITLFWINLLFAPLIRIFVQIVTSRMIERLT